MATSCGSSSSSSGFSSDDDIPDVSNGPSAAVQAASVHVEVVDATEQTGTTRTSPSASQVPLSSLGVRSCCQEAANAIRTTSNPLDVPYEQYIAAIGHVISHWPSVETGSAPSELDNMLQSYHVLRAELYETFHRAYPLTEDMYLQWLSDCRARKATLATQKKLYELAQADYWSVPITLQSLRFLKDTGHEDELKSAISTAQQTVGMHFTRGHEVWALCRDFVTEMNDERDTEDDGNERAKTRAIRALFGQQMQLPLDHNDLVLSEFRAWSAYHPPDEEAQAGALDAAVARQTKVFGPLMKKLRALEATVHAPNAPEKAWLDYLSFVKHRVAPFLATEDKGKQLVVCLYERAVSMQCLSSTLWTSYFEYVEADETKARLTIAHRAVRNVPFDASSWSNWLIELERQHTPFQAMRQVIEHALLVRSNVPLDHVQLLGALLTWCDVVRRYVSSSLAADMSVETLVHHVETYVSTTFAACQHAMATAYPAYVDGVLVLADYHAKCCWTLLTTYHPPDVTVVETVTRVWHETLDSGLGDHAATWIAYLTALQRMHRWSIAALRTMVFEHAVHRVKTSTRALADAWLVFEREHGDLSTYLCARQYHKQHAASVQCLADAGVSTRDRDTKRMARKPSRADQQEPLAKRAKVRLLPSSAKQKQKVSTAGTRRAAKIREHARLSNEHTLFVSNVSKAASQGDVEAVFRDISTLQAVRLVVKTRGDRVVSRGIAYVQFRDDHGVQAGLERNGVLVHGQPLRMVLSNPPVSAASRALDEQCHGFWKADPLTLYLGSLRRRGSTAPVTPDQLQVAVQEAMQTVGERVDVTRVEVLKDRHGQWKNYGLVQMAHVAHVASCVANVAALHATLGDQVTVQPSRFSIASMLEQQHKQQVARKGARHRDKVPQTRPTMRLALGSTTSLVPRALRQKAVGPTMASTIVPKSNHDFRNLVLDTS